MASLRRLLGGAGTLVALAAVAGVLLVSAWILVQGYGVAEPDGGSGGLLALGPSLLNLVLFLPVPAALAFAPRTTMRWLGLPLAVVHTFLVFVFGLSIGGLHLWTSLPLVWVAATLRLLGEGPRPAPAAPAAAEGTA